MLSNISWSQFIIFLVVTLPVYYGYVIAKYYRKEIFQLINRFTGGKLVAPWEKERNPWESGTQ